MFTPDDDYDPKLSRRKQKKPKRFPFSSTAPDRPCDILPNGELLHANEFFNFWQELEKLKWKKSVLGLFLKNQHSRNITVYMYYIYSSDI